MSEKIKKGYLDSCCFIEAVSFDQAKHKPAREYDVLYTKALLEAHFDEEVKLFTSSLSIAECQCIKDEKDQRILNDELKENFRVILTSGRFVALIQDTIIVAQQARDLIWVHGLKFAGADAIHVASAVSAGCDEFLTYDKPIMDNAVALYDLFGLRVIEPRFTGLVPPSKQPFAGSLFIPPEIANPGAE